MTQRGLDFGHWAQSGEKLNIIRIRHIPGMKSMTSNDKMLVLPPLGITDTEQTKTLHTSICREMRNYMPATVFAAEINGDAADYIAADNMTMTDDTMNGPEAARLGRALGASYVLCSKVRQIRPYPPQILDIFMAVIDTKTGRPMVSLSAAFNASDQQIVIAVAQYLQRRRARKYNDNSLDIMLRSPTEYQAFVAAECSKALAQCLRTPPPLKKTTLSDDNKKGGFATPGPNPKEVE